MLILGLTLIEFSPKRIINSVSNLHRMNKQLLFLFSLVMLSACGQNVPPVSIVNEETNSPVEINIHSFLQNVPELDAKVDSVFNTMTHNAIVSQLIMPATGRLGQPEDSIKALIKEHLIGGVLLLNGTVEQCKNWTTNFEAMNKELGNLPFLYSADAEPSLVNRKLKGTTIVPKASMIKDSLEAGKVSQVISNDLNAIGINYNFSPVVDLAKNTTVGYRGFAKDPKNIIPFSQAFIA